VGELRSSDGLPRITARLLLQYLESTSAILERLALIAGKQPSAAEIREVIAKAGNALDSLIGLLERHRAEELKSAATTLESDISVLEHMLSLEGRNYER
jgi:hypothetical protein